MANSNFGFNFGFGKRDDGNDDNNDFNGGIGDFLNDLGQMLSGLGSSMNSSDGESVNYSMTERIARQQIGAQDRPITNTDQQQVQDAVRIVELWLDDATYLPASENKVVAWNATDWLTNTLPAWKRMINPVVAQMNEARLSGLPEEVRDAIGPILGIFSSMSSANFGAQLGNALGDLATQSLSGSDFGIQVAPEHTTALLPHSVNHIAREIAVSPQDVLMYLAAREAARQRLFRHVHWLSERLVSSVEEYAAGLELDNSAMEEAMRNINLELQDPAAIQDALNQMQGMDLEPKIRSRNTGATTRLETLLALVEGWVELVVTNALGDRVPATAALNEAWQRRRRTGGSAEKAFASVVGIEFAAPKVSEAKELWKRVTVAVGEERRDKVWDHPDFLPLAEHLDNSAEFIDSLLDDADTANFDPIAEITALEEMLAQKSEEEQAEQKEWPKPKDQKPEDNQDKKSDDSDK